MANLGFFGMLNQGFNSIGKAFTVIDVNMESLVNVSKVGELKSGAYLREEQILADERLELLSLKREEAKQRVLAAKAAAQPMLEAQ